MRIGIPRGLLYFKYIEFYNSFFSEINVDICLSEATNEEILRIGTEKCSSEACLPMKAYMGHVCNLREKCNVIAVPRIFKCENGKNYCPKMRGLPEMMKSDFKWERIRYKSRGMLPGEKGGSAMAPFLIMTAPLNLSDPREASTSLANEFRKLGIPRQLTKRAYYKAAHAQAKAMSSEPQNNPAHFDNSESGGYNDIGCKRKVFLAGHTYIVNDPFLNMNIADKLHKAGIGIITEEYVGREQKDHYLRKLEKRPYWSNFSEIYGAGKHLICEKMIDGVIFISSFSCGTDDFTAEMLKEAAEDLPFMTLKLDEQTGEAGFNTRLEAFCDILKSS